jgi:hypothetical protein
MASKTSGSNKFILLGDGTIVSKERIILLNVDYENKKKVYKLFLEGKRMTLYLSKEDYEIVKENLTEE